jgi:hypothetical protein
MDVRRGDLVRGPPFRGDNSPLCAQRIEMPPGTRVTM